VHKQFLKMLVEPGTCEGSYIRYYHCCLGSASTHGKQLISLDTARLKALNNCNRFIAVSRETASRRMWTMRQHVSQVFARLDRR
jgi:hypothetical protein